MYTGKYEDQHIIFEKMKTKEKKDHPLHKYPVHTAAVYLVERGYES